MLSEQPSLTFGIRILKHNPCYVNMTNMQHMSPVVSDLRIVCQFLQLRITSQQMIHSI